MRRLARGVLALVVLVAILIGVPWALAAFVGWPLPRGVPSWGEISSMLDGASISDAALLKALACATWVLWSLLAVCFAAEVRASMRGRQARSVPIAGIVQPIIRELVMSAALLVGSLRPAGAVPVLPTSIAAMTVPSSATTTAAPASEPVPDSGPPLPTCVVVPRDSLWRLAEAHLGDGLRWREIWDLNRGKSFPDRRRFADPSLIHPGWVLALPADAVGLTAAEPARHVDAELTRPETAPPPPAPTAPTVSPTPEVTAPVLPTTSTSTSAPVAANGHAPKRASPAIEDDPDFRAVPLLAGSGLLAAGLVVTLTRLRRRQLRHRARGHMPRLPEYDASRAEVHLRRAATGAPFDRLDLALRVLAHGLGRREPGPCPGVSAVSVGPDSIEVLLTDSVHAPADPFLVEADGRAWTLPASVPDSELRPVADTQAGPAPALVTVGMIDERSVLIDLEAGARTLIGGDPSDAEALLWTLALDLVTSNRADDINVIVIGEPPEGIDTVGRARVFPRVGDVIEEICSEATALTDSLRARRRPTTFEARVDNPSDVFTPTVVLVATPQPGVDRLLAAAHEHHCLAVVVAGECDGEFDRELCVEGDTLVLKPVGLRLTPAHLPPDVLRAAGKLLQTAADLSPGEPLELRAAQNEPSQPLAVGPDRLPLEFDAHGQPIVPAGHVMVRVLGPVEILGGQQPIDRRRSIELVTYLALHPEGIDDGRLRTALWPEGAPTQAAFNETVSRARRMLGLDPQGNHHLRHVDNRRYRVGPYVFTDAALLEESVGGDTWLDVLRLVRGLPFDGTSAGYEWAYEEGQAHRLVVLIEEAGNNSDQRDERMSPVSVSMR